MILDQIRIFVVPHSKIVEYLLNPAHPPSQIERHAPQAVRELMIDVVASEPAGIGDRFRPDELENLAFNETGALSRPRSHPVSVWTE